VGAKTFNFASEVRIPAQLGTFASNFCMLVETY